MRSSELFDQRGRSRALVFGDAQALCETVFTAVNLIDWRDVGDGRDAASHMSLGRALVARPGTLALVECASCLSIEIPTFPLVSAGQDFIDGLLDAGLDVSIVGIHETRQFTLVTVDGTLVYVGRTPLWVPMDERPWGEVRATIYADGFMTGERVQFENLGCVQEAMACDSSRPVFATVEFEHQAGFLMRPPRESSVLVLSWDSVAMRAENVAAAQDVTSERATYAEVLVLDEAPSPFESLRPDEDIRTHCWITSPEHELLEAQQDLTWELNTLGWAYSNVYRISDYLDASQLEDVRPVHEAWLAVHCDRAAGRSHVAPIHRRLTARQIEAARSALYDLDMVACLELLEIVRAHPPLPSQTGRPGRAEQPRQRRGALPEWANGTG